MSTFSKINSLFLFVAVGLSTIGQIQNIPASGGFFQDSEGNETPVYFSISSQSLWGVINLGSSSSTLLNIYSYADSKEEQKYNSQGRIALESSLKSFSSNYLSFSGKIDCSSIREILYPFHFYF